METVPSWVLVLMMWGSGMNTPSITTSPGLYQTEGECNVAAATFNDQAPFQGDRSAAICIPGPKLVLTPVQKRK